MTLRGNIYTFKPMNLFFLKKNFFDGWDNAFWLVFANLICVGLVVVGYYGNDFILELGGIPEWATVLISIVFLAACVFSLVTFIFCINECCAKIADFKSVGFKDIFSYFKSCIKDSILFTLLLLLIAALAVIGIPFYLAMGNMIGIFLAALMGWGILICAFSLQWFLPLRSQMQGNFKKTLKKCFIIFFDNTWFSIFIFFYNLILTVLSLLVFVLPGFAGIVLALNNALRLRLYKYDWMEEHPDLSMKEARKQIPWAELIAEDYETLGPKTFKNIIFPWK